MAFIYISYGPLDGALARTVRMHLEDAGYPTWLDEIRETDDAQLAVLASAIASAAAVVVVGGPGLDYSDLVKWEISVASSSEVPILPLRSAADIPAVLATLETLVEKPPALIPLPIPMRWDSEPPPRHRRIGRFGWIMLLAAVLIGLFWLLRLAVFAPDNSEGSLPPTPSALSTEPAGAAAPALTEEPQPSPTVPSTTPTLSASPTTTASPSPNPTASTTSTARPTTTPSVTPTATQPSTSTATHTATATLTPTSSPTSSNTPSPSPAPTATPTDTPSPTPTATPTPTETRPVPTEWPTAAPGPKWLTNTPGP